MEGESVLFIRDDRTGEARASVLFPIRRCWRSGTRRATSRTRKAGTTSGSRAPARSSSRRVLGSSRRPPRRCGGLRRSQKYELTHRDGNGEILFGERLEYHELQTCITYAHDPDLWTSPVPTFDPKALPSHGRQAAEPATREDRGAGGQHLGRLQRLGVGRGGRRSSPHIPSSCVAISRNAIRARSSSRTSRSAGWIPAGA